MNESAHLCRTEQMDLTGLTFWAPTWAGEGKPDRMDAYIAQDLTVRFDWRDGEWKEYISVLATHLRADGRPRRYGRMTRFFLTRNDYPGWVTPLMVRYIEARPLPTTVVTFVEAAA